MLSGKRNFFSAKRIAVCGILTAAALVLGFIEKLIPLDVVFVGFKLGFSNIVVLFALYKLNLFDAFSVCVLKIFACGLAFGGPIYLLYSLSGGLLSFIVMLISKKRLNIITDSILGSEFINIGQIICACYVISTKAILYYLPFLLLAGVFTGALIGCVSNIAIKRIKI